MMLRRHWGKETKLLTSKAVKKQSNLLMLLTRDNWDKNCDRQTDTKDETIIIRTQLLKHRHSFLFLAHGSPSTHSTNTNLHVSRTLSYFFLSVAGWWLSDCCRYFLPLWENQNSHTHFQKYFSLWIRKPWDILFPETNFAGHRNRALKPPLPKKPGLCRENKEEMGPYLCTEWNLRRRYCVKFVYT